MAVTKKPDLSDPILRAKLAKGMGHNYYGEPAWPNDLLYIFPVVILGTFAGVIGLAVLDPAAIGEPANPFATPLEILPEWYFFPVFQLLRTVPNKLLGVLLMAAVPAGLITVPFIESINKFQNPFRRPVATTVFLIGTVFAIYLGIGATLPIDISLTLGLFELFTLSFYRLQSPISNARWGFVNDKMSNLIVPQKRKCFFFYCSYKIFSRKKKKHFF